LSGTGSARRTLLRQRGVRRALVIAIVVLTTILASSLPASLEGLGIVAVLVLVAMDVMAVVATDALAFVRGAVLDERERANRDRAYRRGFRILGLALVLTLLVATVGAQVATATSAGSQSPSELNAGIVGRVVVAILNLLVMMPTLVLVWADAVPADDGAAATTSHSTRLRAGAAWLLLPAILAVWVVDVATAPSTAAWASDTFVEGFSMSGATCTHVVSGRIVGLEFGAIVGLRAEVCWNGVDAFVVGDPTVPLPASAIARLNPPGGGIPAQYLDPADPQATLCGAESNGDFAVLSPPVCTAVIDPTGTLHYTVRARLTPLPFGIAAGDVRVNLVVTRAGVVLLSGG
jgi:hypothetical protein